MFDPAQQNSTPGNGVDPSTLAASGGADVKVPPTTAVRIDSTHVQSQTGEQSESEVASTPTDFTTLDDLGNTSSLSSAQTPLDHVQTLSEDTTDSLASPTTPVIQSRPDAVLNGVDIDSVASQLEKQVEAGGIIVEPSSTTNQEKNTIATAPIVSAPTPPSSSTSVARVANAQAIEPLPLTPTRQFGTANSPGTTTSTGIPLSVSPQALVPKKTSQEFATLPASVAEEVIDDTPVISQLSAQDDKSSEKLSQDTPLAQDTTIKQSSIVAERVVDATASSGNTQVAEAPEVSASVVASQEESQQDGAQLDMTSQEDAQVVVAQPNEQAQAEPTQEATQPAEDSFQGAGSPTQTTYSSLLDLLVDKRYIDEQTANKISVENISSGVPVEEILERDTYISSLDLTQAKAEFHRIPFVNLSQVGIFPEALNKIPESVARRYTMLPFAFEPETNVLNVAMVNPLDLGAISFTEQKAGVTLVPYYALPEEVERLIAEYYSHSLSSEVTAALEQTKQTNIQLNQKQESQNLSGETIRQAPITKIVQTVVSFAVKARASDIHIEPLEDRTRVRYRIDGILMEKLILPSSVHEAVVSRIKILSGLKIDEKRIPQDGRFNFQTSGDEVDLRVSTLPTVYGEKIVMRLLKKNAKVPELTELGLTGLALKWVRDAIQVPHGIVLVTGPTGSGKTTTLYSILNILNTSKVNIMTLEDPVEYQMPGVNQVQINTQAGLTFATGLRSFLRQDPNIIMVGEIRDSETAELAIQASLTGHLVFSTLHTSSATGALPRLLDMGAEPFLLASSMTLVMAQRVMRVLNEQYKEAYKPEKVVLDDIKQVLGARFSSWLQQKNIKEEEVVLYRSRQDRPHTEPEYKGRIAIFEVLRMTEDIGRLVLERKPATDIEKLALKDGMLLMKQDGYLKVLEGFTTVEEVLRVAQV